MGSCQNLKSMRKPYERFSSSASIIFTATFNVHIFFQVYEYVKSYLGDTRDTGEFAREFIERRKKQRDKTAASLPSFPQVSIANLWQIVIFVLFSK